MSAAPSRRDARSTSSPCAVLAVTTAKLCATPRCVTGIPAAAGAAIAELVTPGNDLERHARASARERLLAAAAEHERVAALQPHDDVSRRARARRAARRSAPAASPRGRAPCRRRCARRSGRELQQRRGREPVVHDDVGEREHLSAAHGDELRVARAGADEVDEAAHATSSSRRSRSSEPAAQLVAAAGAHERRRLVEVERLAPPARARREVRQLRQRLAPDLRHDGEHLRPLLAVPRLEVLADLARERRRARRPCRSRRRGRPGGRSPAPRSRSSGCRPSRSRARRALGPRARSRRARPGRRTSATHTNAPSRSSGRHAPFANTSTSATVLERRLALGAHDDVIAPAASSLDLSLATASRRSRRVSSRELQQHRVARTASLRRLLGRGRRPVRSRLLGVGLRARAGRPSSGCRTPCRSRAPTTSGRRARARRAGRRGCRGRSRSTCSRGRRARGTGPRARGCRPTRASRVQSASGLSFTMPPWSRSSSTFAMFLRLFHCSRRRPATHASSVASLRFSGSTLRISQHESRRSTPRYIRFGPVLFHEAFDLDAGRGTRTRPRCRSARGPPRTASRSRAAGVRCRA